MRLSHTLYINSHRDYTRHRDRLKLLACPACKAVGCLNRHGFLRGYGDGSERIQRGWRIFCSNRNRKSGCGGTYSLLLAEMLSRRIANAGQVWRFLNGVLGGACIRKAWNAAASGFSTANGYKLWAAFVRNQSHIRTFLHRLTRPLGNSIPDPAHQLIFHLHTAFHASSSPIAAFQAACQQAFLSL